MIQRSILWACLCLTWLSANAHSSAQTQIICGWEEQIFPSYLLSNSTAKKSPLQPREFELGDPWGLFGVVVTATQDNSPIKVTVQCEEFLELSEFSGVLPASGQQYSIYPKIRYRFDKLSKCRQATPASVTFRVTQGEGITEEITSVVTFRSINDCPFLWVTDDNVTHLGFNFAAYVNEQHPFVDKLLREALDIGVVNRFVGYQEKTPESVLLQVYALWDLMVMRDVRYSSITTTSASSSIARSQHVRLLEETVNNTQANCVDGSALFASLLRKIGIHSSLILVPGHCYVGFWLDEEKQRFVGLETTLIDSMEQRYQAPKEIAGSVPADLRGDLSWPSFVDALVIGTSNLEERRNNQANDPLQFTVIDIAQARLEGVLPIPYSGTEEFLAFDFTYDPEFGDAESTDDSDETVMVNAENEWDSEDDLEHESVRESVHDSEWESEWDSEDEDSDYPVSTSANGRDEWDQE